MEIFGVHIEDGYDSSWTEHTFYTDKKEAIKVAKQRVKERQNEVYKMRKVTVKIIGIVGDMRAPLVK